MLSLVRSSESFEMVPVLRERWVLPPIRNLPLFVPGNPNCKESVEVPNSAANLCKLEHWRDQLRESDGLTCHSDSRHRTGTILRALRRNRVVECFHTWMHSERTAEEA